MQPPVPPDTTEDHPCRGPAGKPERYDARVRAAIVEFAEAVMAWKNSAAASAEFEAYNEQFAEQEFDCVECGGEGWLEHSCCDDDEDEVGPCGGCMGTGIEPIEGRLDREQWMDEQVLRHARGERTLP